MTDLGIMGLLYSSLPGCFMKSIDAHVLLAAAATILIGCSTATAPTKPAGPSASVITIGPPVMTVDTTGSSVCSAGAGPFHARCVASARTDTTICPTFSPQPASAATGQSVQWFNNSGSDITLFQAPDHTPIVTIAAGLTSGGVFWSQAGTIAYTASTCTMSGLIPPDTNDPPQQTIYITTGT
jgi:hypothetical protein